jgi:hypothetical protein
MDKLGFGDLVGGVAGEDGTVAGLLTFLLIDYSIFNNYIQLKQSLLMHL